MSILNTLTEGIVNRDTKQEGEALLVKWTQTGLLEGLQTDRDKHSMARLENQGKSFFVRLLLWLAAMLVLLLLLSQSSVVFSLD